MIRILTNKVAGGWDCGEITKGLGGSEEAVVLLAIALKKHYSVPVEVYHSQKTPGEHFLNNVRFLPIEKFFENKGTKNDIVISFKYPLQASEVTAKQILHWSCEVENPRLLEHIDYFVNPSDYLKTRHFWVPEEKNMVIPFGVDFSQLENVKIPKDENMILYASSPDRGLMEILENWNEIKKHFPKLELTIAYGFERMFAIGGNAILPFKQRILELVEREGINYVGHQDTKEINQLYWKSKYWCLPLNNPDSELFCLNAVKARYCGAIPVVNKIGALKNTVGNYIPWKHFKKGKLTLIEEEAINVFSWKTTIDKFWSKIIKL